MHLASAVLILAVAAVPASAAELDRHAWFNSLLQPGTNVPCCDVSDCHRAQSERRKGAWWAVVEGEWQEIPADKVLDRTSIFEEAVVCHAPPVHWSGGIFRSTIYCFAPPPPGT